MSTRQFVIRGAVIAIAAACAPAAGASAEVTLKAVSAFGRTHLLVKDYLRYIDAVNREGKGLVKIRYLGGPEVANPREQPVGLSKGLLDMIYGPPTYYQGMFPESDLFYGNKTPMERRANGHLKLLDGAFREKLGATILGQFVGDIGVSLWLTKPPKRTPSGGIDLTGVKIRTSPSYRDFIKALGGTSIVMRGVGATYTALERGTVEGTGMPIAMIRDIKIHKFVRYNVQPDFLKTKIVIVVNAKRFDALPAKAQALMASLAEKIEKESFENSAALTRAEAAKLKADGVTTIRLTGAAAKKYRDMFLETPWARASRNPKIIVDVAKAKALAY